MFKWSLKRPYRYAMFVSLTVLLTQKPAVLIVIFYLYFYAGFHIKVQSGTMIVIYGSNMLVSIAWNSNYGCNDTLYNIPYQKA